jgi:hypothetical protein
LFSLLIASGLLFSSIDGIDGFTTTWQTFGAMYVLMIAMMLPAFAYFMPSWVTLGLKVHPSIISFRL